MIPGSNILDMALSVIARQTIAYYREISRSLDDVGQYVSLYAPAEVIVGSFQPVPRALYFEWGLDLQKTYYVLYAPKNITDVGRNVSGDQIAFNGVRFQCESEDDWYQVDGWKRVICIEIKIPGEAVPTFGFNTSPPINDNVNFNQGKISD